MGVDELIVRHLNLVLLSRGAGLPLGNARTGRVLCIIAVICGDAPLTVIGSIIAFNVMAKTSVDSDARFKR